MPLRDDVPLGRGNQHDRTDMARLDLSFGAVDALCATGFRQRFPPHFHETFAIGVVESGETRLRTVRGQWIARAGTILAFSPGEVHGAEPLSPHGFAYRMVYPPVTVLRAIGIDVSPLRHGQPLFAAPVLEDERLGIALRDAHVPLMADGVSPSAESRLVASLRELAVRHRIDGAAAPTVARTRDLDIVECARTFLEAHLGTPLRLASVADACGVSSFALIHIFARVVGVPPYAYLLQLRVNRAKALLGDGWGVADAAYECGFADQSHLTRTFKKVVGVPPGRYVRGIRRTAA